ncbi:acyltransferase family protein [Novipirellula artificiosorum]|uniref:Glucans biosynthesis protein C n=1 Tax=Novipirellula artificiosorum TaxID=2528016 RepID=A0A5C6D9X0_9BACT|nr:acyltransferase family protein [Novipirellula artificiosorum]TWU33933.1 Glucans biosynthesis protein C [Novipirellula artificiosorum]
MQNDAHTDRLHSLDALRAWAMLLGIVLHAAWFMSTRYFGTPITDADGSYFYEYVLYFIHIFRLQAFFLMAGLFAHLVFSRRGTWRFIWHRISRIAIPLLIGWLLLYPVMMLQYAWGGIESGRILTDQGLGATTLQELVSSLQMNASAFIHLWFLYDLLVIYAITLIVVLLMHKVIDRSGRIRRQISRGFRWLLQSWWSIVLLSIPSAIFLYFEDWWWGLGAYPINFIPDWPGLMGYCLFFAAGWLLYSQLNLLSDISRNWRRKLGLGVALSIPLFVVSTVLDYSVTPTYPLLDSNSFVRDHRDLLAAADRHVAEPNGADQLLNPSRMIVDALSPEYLALLENHDQLTPDQKVGLATEINDAVLSSESLAAPENWTTAKLPKEVAEMLADDSNRSDPAKLQLLNKKLLEATLPGMFLTDFKDRPRVRIYKAVFSAGYALAMWLLVFGAIGLFTHYFSHPSPVSRYIADSAYWIYLVHLPILFQIEVLVAPYQWGLFGIPKFLFYTAVTTVLCFASYHYLVRSSLIGRVLNGRTYPFKPLIKPRIVSMPGDVLANEAFDVEQTNPVPGQEIP